MTITEAKEAIRDFVLPDPGSISAALLLEDVLLRVAGDHGDEVAEGLVREFNLSTKMPR